MAGTAHTTEGTPQTTGGGREEDTDCGGAMGNSSVVLSQYSRTSCQSSWTADSSQLAKGINSRSW